MKKQREIVKNIRNYRNGRKILEIRNYSFNQRSINNLAVEDHLEENWPVVYQIYNNNEIYIGENFSIFFEFEHINQNFKNKTIN